MKTAHEAAKDHIENISNKGTREDQIVHLLAHITLQIARLLDGIQRKERTP